MGFLSVRCFDALAELYKCMGEEDILAGLWRRRGASDSTRIGLSLMQVGGRGVGMR